MNVERLFSTPPWRLSFSQRSWLRSHRDSADRYEQRWQVTLF